MRRWGVWESFSRAPKKPPPAHGIKMKKAGTTWWGQRWIDALHQVLRGDSSRLARGRTYARAGRTHDLVITGGKVTAKVTGSRATPYKITITLAQLPDAAWKAAIAGMAAKAQFSAELLAGQMPREIDEVFRAADASLFPGKRSELVTSCSCPDWGDPCKHVAATHYVLGEALDRDPFLLFELRSRTKEQVLEALRAARGGGGEVGDTGEAGEAGESSEAAVTATRGRAARKTGKKTGKKTDKKTDTKSAAPAAATTNGRTGTKTAGKPAKLPAKAPAKVDPRDYDRPREALPSMHFSFDAPSAHGALLRQLGTPAAWNADGSPADALAPLVRGAAEAARRIAMATAAPEPLPMRRRRARPASG